MFGQMVTQHAKVQALAELQERWAESSYPSTVGVDWVWYLE